MPLSRVVFHEIMSYLREFYHEIMVFLGAVYHEIPFFKELEKIDTKKHPVENSIGCEDIRLCFYFLILTSSWLNGISIFAFLNAATTFSCKSKFTVQ